MFEKSEGNGNHNDSTLRVRVQTCVFPTEFVLIPFLKICAKNVPFNAGLYFDKKTAELAIEYRFV